MRRSDNLLSIDELQHLLKGIRINIKDVNLPHLGLLHVLVQHAIKDHRPGDIFCYIVSLLGLILTLQPR